MPRRRGAERRTTAERPGPATDRVPRVLALAIVAIVLVSGTACSPRDASTGPGPAPSNEPAITAPRLVVVRKGADAPDADVPVVRADVAATLAARQRGLGGRDRVEPGEGMLFVYREPVLRTFWMKDCPFGLDIAFVAADGRVTRLLTLGPGTGLPDSEIPRAESGAPVVYVLETAAGWLRGQGLREGDRIDVSRAVAGVVPE